MRSAAETHVSDDRLIDLVLELPEPGEQRRALDHVLACPACEKRFQELCRESELLRGLAGPAGITLQRPSTGRAARASHHPPPAARSRLVAWAGAAAAGILVVAAMVFWPRNERRLDYWLPVEQERIVARSGSADAANRAVREAIDAYRRHETSRVVELLQGSAALNEHEPLKLILASALVWERRPDQARALLAELKVETLPLPARDRARWILATALRQSGDDAAARAILADLASRPGELSDRAAGQLAAAP
ncbi:MAG: hypothetical protein ACREAA_10215 [Candidatus Polarisedimenticolia bacterium]